MKGEVIGKVYLVIICCKLALLDKTSQGRPRYHLVRSKSSVCMYTHIHTHTSIHIDKHDDIMFVYEVRVIDIYINPYR